MNDKDQARINVCEIPRRTLFDWDNYLVEKMAELRRLVDECRSSLNENTTK
jgi:hypothetical protein